MNNYMKSNISTLNEAYNAFCKIPFPMVKYDQEIGHFHGPLVEYDGYIAGRVQSMIANQKIEPLEFDSSIEEQLNELSEKRPDLDQEVKKYREYINEIKKMISLTHETE